MRFGKAARAGINSIKSAVAKRGQQMQQRPQRSQGLQRPPMSPAVLNAPMQAAAKQAAQQAAQQTALQATQQAAPSQRFGPGQMPMVPNQGMGNATPQQSSTPPSQGMMGKGLAGLGAAAVKAFKKGGKVKSSASKRADGIATKGKTKGRFI